MMAASLLSVHVSTFPSLLFDSCDNNSNESNSMINFNSNDGFFDNRTSSSSNSYNTTLFDWSDIPCHDENEQSYIHYSIIDDVKEDDRLSSSHCNMFSMDDCYSPRTVLQVSNAQSIDQLKDVQPAVVCSSTTKTLHERSLSNSSNSSSTCSIDKVIVPTKKLRIKTTSVTFSDRIAVREYNIVPTIHPCCIDGLAIELGWNYTDTCTTSNVSTHSTTNQHQQQRVVATSTTIDDRSITKSTTTTATSANSPFIRRKSRYTGTINKSINYLRLNYFERRERLERMTGKSELQMLRELHDHDDES